jgi:hypothetical protein
LSITIRNSAKSGCSTKCIFTLPQSADLTGSITVSIKFRAHYLNNGSCAEGYEH